MMIRRWGPGPDERSEIEREKSLPLFVHWNAKNIHFDLSAW